MKRISIALLAALAAAPACTGDPGKPGGDDDGSDGSNTQGDEWDQELAKREYDYGAALRIAALRLTGDLPTMAEMNTISAAADNAAKKVAYEGLVQTYMGRPTFARQMFLFWRDTFKTGETPEFDTAAALAAQISTGVGSYTDLFTKSSQACPTFDSNTGTFTPAECTGNAPKAGVLSNPGLMKQFFSNFGFRRVKFIQETFDCVKFPVPSQIAGTPTEVGGSAPYTNLFPFTSIAGTDSGGRVNFHDVSSVICAQCHANINHIAPLFANFDMNGAYQPQIAVPTPLDGAPLAQLSDYLPAGEPLAWRFGVTVSDLPSLGAAMAADPDVQTCGVARMWNWALGKTDIVDTLQVVPPEVIQDQVAAFSSGGFNLKNLIYTVFTSDDFTKF